MGDPARQLQIRNKPGMKLVGDDMRDRGRKIAPARKSPGRKKGAVINKSEEIRTVAREMVEKGERPRPIEIVRKLKEKGIDIVAAQVSMAVRGTGLEFRPSRAAPPPPFDAMPDPAAAMSRVSVQDLLMVREFVKEMGSMEKAVTAMIAYTHLGGPGGVGGTGG